MSKTIGLITANYLSAGFTDVMESRPLAAMPFGGRYRLIDFPLSNMANSGISSVGLIVPFNNRSLIDHVGTGKAWGFGRKTHSMFILPGSVYGRRTSDCKFLLRDIIENRRYFNYDNPDYILMCSSNRVFSMDFQALINFHEQTGCQVTKVYNGSEFLDCFILNREFLNDIATWFSNLDYMDIIRIIEEHMPDCPVARYEFIGYEHNIDCMSDYYEASMDLLKETVQQMLFSSAGTIYTNIQDRCPTFYAPTAVVKNSIIAAGSTIEGTVENSIIFRSSHISKGATVKNCVLLQHAEIDSGAEIKYFICDKRVHVTGDVKISGSKNTPYYVKKGLTI